MHMRVWRLTKNKHAHIAFSGEGARLAGGRWNPKGVAIVYTSHTRSLAALELLVHLEPDDISDFVFIPADIPDELIETFDMSSLPDDWQSQTDLLQQTGAAWVTEKRSAALLVPSAIMPTEPNVLINPSHYDTARVRIGPAETFALDPRLR